MTGGSSLANEPWRVGFGAAAQRLCDFGFQSEIMVAAIASPESHEGSGEKRRWKVGCWSSNDVAQIAGQGEDQACQSQGLPATRCRPETCALPKIGSQSDASQLWRMTIVRVSFWMYCVNTRCRRQ